MRTGLMAAVLAVAVAGFAASDAEAVTCTPATAIAARAGQETMIRPNCSESTAPSGYVHMTITRHPQHGILLPVAFGGSIGYRPDPGYTGSDSFSYYGDMGGGSQASAVVVQPIAVSADANQAPTCSVPTKTLTARQGTAKALPIHCSDPDGDPITVQIIAQPTRGTLGSIVADSATARHVDYSVTDPTGTDSVSYRASDGTATSAVVTQTLRALTADGNTPPTCSGGALTVLPGAYGVLLDCSDADGDPLTLRPLSAPTLGTVAFTSYSLSYHSTGATAGSDHFTYTANDGRADATTASVDVTIQPPSAPACAVTTDASTPAYLGSTYVMHVHCRPGSTGLPIQFVVEDAPDHAATFSNGSSNAFSIDYSVTPEPGYHGTDSIRWHAVGPGGMATAAQTWSYTVADAPAGNRAPWCVGSNTEYLVRNDDTHDVTITCSDHDAADQDAIVVVTPPAHGTLTGLDATTQVAYPKVTYVPNAGYDGTDRFQLRLDDGRGGQSATITQDMMVLRAAYNRPPSCDGRYGLVTTGGSVASGGSGSWNRLCADADGDPVTLHVVGQPSAGTASVSPTGVLSYQSPAGLNARVTVPMSAQDDHGGATDFAFTVDVGTVTTPGGGGAGGGGAAGTGTSGGGSGGGAATPKPTLPASTAPAPSTDPAPAPGGSTPAPASTAPRQVTPTVPGLDLGDATAQLTTASAGRTITVTGTRPLTVMTLSCARACTVLARPTFVLPAGSGRSARSSAARAVRGSLQRLQLGAGKHGKVVLRVPAGVRKRLGSTRTVTVRYAVSVLHADGTTSRGTTSFRVRVPR
ncbi:MAG: outer rane adhesin like protein [Solirubrobacterales bacterium]|nr:outer rane adhesin like protein [Solirubrobacterales bacterium]